MPQFFYVVYVYVRIIHHRKIIPQDNLPLLFQIFFFSRFFLSTVVKAMLGVVGGRIKYEQ